MRVLRDVVVDRTSPDELMAVSGAPGVTGEMMTLDLMGDGRALSLRVRVLESRPVILNGAVRHRLRLGLSAVAAEQRPAEVPSHQQNAIRVEAL